MQLMIIDVKSRIPRAVIIGNSKDNCMTAVILCTKLY